MSRQMLNRLPLLCVAVLVVSSLAWAKTYHMTSTDAVPSSSADISVGKEKNGDIKVDVKARHLAKPGRLTPSANSYIVWLQQEGSEPQSLGELKIGDNLKGELKGTTTHSNFKVFITAETESQTAFPSEQVVLRATVQE